MKFYEMLNSASVVRGIPVTNDGADNYYIVVGVWESFNDGDGDFFFTYEDSDAGESWTLRGYKVDVLEGVQIVLDTNGQARVHSGKIIFRNNEMCLAPCEENDDPNQALVLYRHDAAPRKLIGHKPRSASVSRYLNGDNVDVHYVHAGDQPTVVALVTVCPGSKLWMTEDRKLRVAGTGATWSKPFNTARYQTVETTSHVIEIKGSSFEDLNAAAAASSRQEDHASVEAWNKSRMVVFTARPSDEPGVIKASAAQALGADPADSFQYEEVASA